MNKLIIPESHFGITKTLRIPEDMVDKIMHFLSVPKNINFFDKIFIFLLNLFLFCYSIYIRKIISHRRKHNA